MRLSLVPGVGVFLMTRISPKDDEWALLAANRESVNLATGEPLRLRVRIAQKKITVTVQRSVVLRATLQDFDPRGRWGVGGPFGSRSSWKSLGIR